MLGGKPPDQSLEATALVNEAFVRLIDREGIDWENRAHFFGGAARTMKNILVDRARRRHAKKRGGGIEKLPFDEEVHVPAREEETDLLALDEALDKLYGMDASLSRLVELRFFLALNVQETAEALGVSSATVKRGFCTAKIWLRRELDGS